MMEKRHPNRIIGERIGKEPGPLLVIFAQIHGNEPAGYYALQELFKAIDQEYENNPNFEFIGGIVGILGNVKAAQRNVRYIDKDLNRSWLPESVKRIRATDDWSQLDAEDQEIKANLEVIEDYRRIHPANTYHYFGFAYDKPPTGGYSLFPLPMTRRAAWRCLCTHPSYTAF